MNATKLKTVQLDWQAVNDDLQMYSHEPATTLLDPALKWEVDYTQYGYNEHNTKIWKKIMPVAGWTQELVDQLPLDNPQIQLTRQDPGQVLPRHVDRFFMLQKNFPNDKRDIVRLLVYLEDWKAGHQLCLDDGMIYNWKRGDTWIWPPQTPHIAANTGIETKWTCNVTGFLNDKSSCNW